MAAVRTTRSALPALHYSAAKAALLSFSKYLSKEEVADLVLFLASRAGNVTGADFRIDGGLITSL